MNPVSKSRIAEFVGLFFDSKEKERLIRATESLTDEDAAEIIASIDKYKAARRGFRGIAQEIFSDEPVSEYEIADFLGDQESYVHAGREAQERAFDETLDTLSEQLIDTSKIPLTVQMLASSDMLSVPESIEKMDRRLGQIKRERLDRELPWDSPVTDDERKIKRQKIVEDHDILKKKLVDTLENFPRIWGSGQEAIAHLEPITDLGLLFGSWKKEEGLPLLAQKLRQCAAYKTLHRYAHPLLELITLSELLEQEELDAESIEQTLWVLAQGEGRPGAHIISSRLTIPRLHLYPELALHLEGIVDNPGDSLSVRGRSRLYCAIESLVRAVPSDKRNKQMEVQDLAWCALLLRKAYEHVRAGTLANEALALASEVGSRIRNPFLWWSRLGDAYFTAAFSSSDSSNTGWLQGQKCYDTALLDAFDANKHMIYLRKALAVAEQVGFYGPKLSPEEVPPFLALANEGVTLANKALENGSRPESAIFIRARIEAVWTTVARTAVLGGGDSLEGKFFDSVKEVLAAQPLHSGAIRIVYSFLAEKGDVVSALNWLDEHIVSLRGNNTSSYQRLADYLEFRAAEHALDIGLEGEARVRLIRIVNETQPSNSEAWGLLAQLGFSAGALHEQVAQELYAQATQQIPGSEKRKELAKKALLSNRSFMESDPGMTDVVPWTRQARLLLFMDDFTAAIEILKELQLKFPSDPYVQFHLGEAHYRQGVASAAAGMGAKATEDYEEATVALKRAWELERRVDTAHRLSACWSRRDEIVKQRYWLEEAEELDPSDGWTKFSLGWSNYKTGALDAAFSYWVEAVQCLSTENLETDRQRALGRLAAHSVVRYGEGRRVDDLNLEHLSPNAIVMIASAASGAGWRYSSVIESLGRCLDTVPMLGRRRIPHAVRAHLLFLQLAGGDEFAYQWHSRWYENFRALKDRSLFVEYAAGGKSVFRRAASWSILENIGFGLQGISRKLDSEIDWRRWGEFVQAASSWGLQKDYYRDAYSTFPTGDVGCEELYLVLQKLNSRLFHRALDEIGYDSGQANGVQSPEVLSNFPIEFEIIPAREIDPSAPESVLVHTDELSSQIILNSTNKLIEHRGVSDLRKSWHLSGETLCCSFENNDDLSSVDLDLLRSPALRSGNLITMSGSRGVNVCWQIWS